LPVALQRLRHSFVPSTNAVGSAVYNFIASELETINLAISYVRASNPAFPHLLSDSLDFYIRNKSQCFRRYKKSEAGYHYGIFLLLF
jgi:hypothetical protein